VVEELNLNMVYTAKTRLTKRVKDLYDETPINVQLLDVKDNQSVSLAVVPVDEKMVNVGPLTNLKGSIVGDAWETRTVHLGDTVNIPYGRIVVNPTWRYTEGWFGTSISVYHRSVSSVADQYRYAVSATRDDEKNTIVNLSLRDKSAQRAADVLNKVIEVYNNDAIASKKRVVEYSYDYIMNDLPNWMRNLEPRKWNWHHSNVRIKL